MILFMERRVQSSAQLVELGDIVPVEDEFDEVVQTAVIRIFGEYAELHSRHPETFGNKLVAIVDEFGEKACLAFSRVEQEREVILESPMCLDADKIRYFGALSFARGYIDRAVFEDICQKVSPIGVNGEVRALDEDVLQSACELLRITEDA